MSILSTNFNSVQNQCLSSKSQSHVSRTSVPWFDSPSDEALEDVGA